MGIYVISLFGATFLAFLAERYSNGQVDENGNIKLNNYMVVALITFLVFISGFRYMNYFLGDEYNYRIGVEGMMGEPLQPPTLSLGEEWLFYFISWISANVFKTSQALIFIAAFITNTSIVLYFKKYARPFWLAVFLYISGGAYFTSMNVIRQYLAIAIVIWCFHFIRKKRILPYIILVIVATEFHSSALIMFPVYFILKRKKIDKWTIALVVMSILILTNFEKIMSLVLPNTKYDDYLNSILSGGYGVKFIRVIASLLPYTIILIYNEYMTDNLKIGYEQINSVIVSAGISIISLAYVYVARFDLYYSIVAYLCIIKVPELFKTKGRNLIALSICILYFIFGGYMMWNYSTYYNVLLHNVEGVLY